MQDRHLICRYSAAAHCLNDFILHNSNISKGVNSNIGRVSRVEDPKGKGEGKCEISSELGIRILRRTTQFNFL